jgi:hypothetical protein
VKTSIVAFVFLAFLSTARPQGRPASAGQIELRKYEAAQRVDAPQTPQGRTDINQLQHDADELARLAQSIPPDIGSVANGALPKDILEKLKRIEKLSKHLRSELGQ